MKNILILTFLFCLASVCFGDYLRQPESLPRSRIHSLEVDFSGRGYGSNQHCGSYGVMIELKKRGSHRRCFIHLGNPGDGEIISKNRYNARNVRNCDLRVNTDDNILFQIYTNTYNSFCLSRVQVRTENNQTFQFEFNQFFATETREDMVLINTNAHSQTSHQLASLTCPQTGCPIGDIHAYDLQRPSAHFCMVNTNCQYVSSRGLRDEGNGLICQESANNYGLPLYCCNSGSHGDIPDCAELEPRTTITRPTPNPLSSHEVYGNPHNQYGQPLAGTPFTLHGPFLNIAIKTRTFGPGNIIQGLRTISSQGEIESFGMEDGELDNVSFFTVPSGQKITGVTLKYGWFIDSLGFTTDRNVSLGPVGGGGGVTTYIRADNSAFELTSIYGEVINSPSNYDDSPAISKLRFEFAEVQTV
jgi:hypothetical protein